MDINIGKVQVGVSSRQLLDIWTFEQVQETESYIGFYVERDIMRLLRKDMKKQIRLYKGKR